MTNEDREKFLKLMVDELNKLEFSVESVLFDEGPGYLLGLGDKRAHVLFDPDSVDMQINACFKALCNCWIDSFFDDETCVH